MEYHVYWLLNRSCFEFFGDGKYGLFWAKNLIEKWNLLITKKFLFWTFWWEKIRVWVKKLIERWYLLITENFLFWTFPWREIQSFFSQEADEKMIFTWSFWAFHDIPGIGKYGFFCSQSSASLGYGMGGKCKR